MGKIYNSITELVGHTPIVEFKRLEEKLGLKGRIAGKLEYFNPAGSHKDRMAIEIIEAAEKRGEISPDKTTLVEFTSGNTGVAMAAFAAAKGYKFKSRKTEAPAGLPGRDRRCSAGTDRRCF